MPTRFFSTLLILITCCTLATVSSAEDKKADDKPRVLILGDSISIGYTPFVQKMMEGEAVVIRPMGKKNPKTGQVRAENCSGTTNGVKNIDRWLKIDGGNWDMTTVVTITKAPITMIMERTSRNIRMRVAPGCWVIERPIPSLLHHFPSSPVCIGSFAGPKRLVTFHCSSD